MATLKSTTGAEPAEQHEAERSRMGIVVSNDFGAELAASPSVARQEGPDPAERLPWRESRGAASITHKRETIPPLAPKTTVRLLIADEQPVLRHGLRALIALRPHLELAAEASTAAQAVNLAAELEPDLVVMGIHFPDLNGIEATRRILCAQSSAKVVIFSYEASRSIVDEALQAGACAYVLKTGDEEEFFCAIETALAGKLYLSPEVETGIVEDYRTSLRRQFEPVRSMMSPRERRVLQLVAEGRRNKEISASLRVSTKCVEATRSRLAKRLGCSSTAELVRYAIREGIAAA